MDTHGPVRSALLLIFHFHSFRLDPRFVAAERDYLGLIFNKMSVNDNYQF